MFKRAAVLVVSCGALMPGCDAGSQAENKEIIANLVEAGFPTSDIQVHDGAVYVGRDAHVTLEASQEMLEPRGGCTGQTRQRNLVDTRVTKICVNPTSQFNSYSLLSAGLELALENFNSQGLRITFVRGPATGCTASITARTASGTGGSAGFPRGGKPYGTIHIGVGLQNHGVAMSEHVITHALGHTIGFRHSDYYDRSISCGSGGNEGASNVGAIHSPGTPADARGVWSVMDSCFRSNEPGEWSRTDKLALNYLY